MVCWRTEGSKHEEEGSEDKVVHGRGVAARTQAWRDEADGWR